MGLLKLGVSIMKNSAVVDNVNSATRFFLTFDKNGDKELDPDEIAAALEARRFIMNLHNIAANIHLLQTLKGVKTPEALNLRSLCLFLTIALKKWEEDPATTEANMSKRFESIFHRSFILSHPHTTICSAASLGRRHGTGTLKLPRSKRLFAPISIQALAKRFALSCS